MLYLLELSAHLLLLALCELCDLSILGGNYLQALFSLSLQCGQFVLHGLSLVIALGTGLLGLVKVVGG